MSSYRAPLAALVALSAIWGYSWVFLKLGLLDAPPFSYAGLRTLLGALALLAVLPLSGRPLWPGRWRELAVLGLLNTTGAVGCSQWALVEGAANRTSILMYTMPFWTLLLARPLLGERVRGLQWLAIASAGAGLAVVVQPWRGGALAASNVIVLGGAMFWAAGAVTVKRILARAPIDLLALTAWQMLIGALVLLAIALAVDEPPVVWTSRFIGALTVTALISTGFGWMLWVYLLHKLPAGTAGMTTLLVPVIAVASTSWQLGETLAPADTAGIALILVGLAILTTHAIRAHRSVTGTVAPE